MSFENMYGFGGLRQLRLNFSISELTEVLVVIVVVVVEAVLVLVVVVVVV